MNPEMEIYMVNYTFRPWSYSACLASTVDPPRLVRPKDVPRSMLLIRPELVPGSVFVVNLPARCLL